VREFIQNERGNLVLLVLFFLNFLYLYWKNKRKFHRIVLALIIKKNLITEDDKEKRETMDASEDREEKRESLGSKEKIAEDFSDFGESDDEILNQAGLPY
jgi:hypothetical protein